MPRISFEDVYEAFIPNAFVKQKPLALPAFLWSHAPGRFFSFLRIPPALGSTFDHVHYITNISY